MSSNLCHRQYPIERCGLYFAQIENVVIWDLLDGGPWVFDYLDALEPVCQADPDCDWGALDRRSPP